MSRPVRVQPMGELLPVDDQGYLVNICSVNKIKPPWSEVVEFAKEAYLAHLGSKIHSIYIRGSVAKGTAIEGISDVDTLAVLRGEVHRIDDAWLNAFRTDTRKTFPFCEKVEMGLIPESGLFNLEDDEYRWDRLIIKTQCVCVFGEDLASKLPGFKPGKNIAANVYGIRNNVRILKQKLLEGDGRVEIMKSCVWIMKRFLRTGFELVMEDEKAYTRDLYPCYEIFSKYYPERESDMRQVLELALNPVSDKLVILEIVDGFGGWIVKEAALKFPR